MTKAKRKWRVFRCPLSDVLSIHAEASRADQREAHAAHDSASRKTWWFRESNGYGYAGLIRVNDQRARFKAEFVKYEYRRKGIFSALCAAREEFARSRGFTELEVFTNNRERYDRMGWTFVRFNRGGRIAVFRKSIAPE